MAAARKAGAKRPRGGASVPCPFCGSVSRVTETRRSEVRVVRVRKCRGRTVHTFNTTEERDDK